QENQLAALDGSGFVDFESSTGGARIAWRPRESFSARLYAARQLAYSLLVAEASSYVDERIGAGIDFAIGWRLRLDLYDERGSHRYEGVTEATGGAEPREDVERYGIDLKAELPWRLSLQVGYQETRISSSSGSGIPDRKVSQIVANLGFGFGAGTWY
ncbi:MAG: hypothetical protein ABIU84_07550, partial [Thermoanaerobaculia bacterium]